MLVAAMVGFGCSRGGGERAPGPLGGFETDLPSYWSGTPSTEEGEETAPQGGAEIAGKVDKVLAFLLNGDIRQVDETKPYPRKFDEIRVVFTEDMDPSVKDSFKLQRDSVDVAGTLSWYDAKTLEFKFDPADRSPYGAKHEVRFDTETVAKYRTMALNDVNGDGKADTLLGAPTMSPVPAVPSEAYLIWGKSGLSGNQMARDIADVIIKEETSGSRFGFLSAVVGDLDADGYADCAISAPYFDSGRGKVYILFGAESIASTILAADAQTIIKGSANGLYLGEKMSAAGDINGDGYDDLLIAFPKAVGGAGVVYMFSGKGLRSTDPSQQLELDETMAKLTIKGEPAQYRLGLSIASADINGDGLNDILAGAPFTDVGGQQRGRLYIILGKPALGGTIELDYINMPNKKADMRIDGPEFILPASPPFFARSVSNAGDLDGDGSDDILVGAPNEDNAADTMAGAVYEFSGRRIVEDMDVSAKPSDRLLYGDNAGDRLGRAVMGVGRFNNNDLTNYVFSASNFNTDQGKIFLGGQTMSPVLHLAWSSTIPSYFGQGLSALGDIDADGYADFMVSVPSVWPNRSQVVIFKGSANGTLDFANSFSLQSDNNDRRLGIFIGGQLSH